MITVLFACVHNAGRSQMAAAYFNALADPLKARAISAGTDPAARVHAEVITVMREMEIDLSAAVPGHLADSLARAADILVTMGCGASCPVIHGARRREWDLPDPEGRTLEEVRRIRNMVQVQVARLIQELDCGKDAWAEGNRAK